MDLFKNERKKTKLLFFFSSLFRKGRKIDVFTEILENFVVRDTEAVVDVVN